MIFNSAFQQCSALVYLVFILNKLVKLLIVRYKDLLYETPAKIISELID